MGEAGRKYLVSTTDSPAVGVHVTETLGKLMTVIDKQPNSLDLLY